MVNGWQVETVTKKHEIVKTPTIERVIHGEIVIRNACFEFLLMSTDPLLPIHTRNTGPLGIGKTQWQLTSNVIRV